MQLQANGSPPAEFDFDADHSYFMVRLPVHPAALEVADLEMWELADAVTGQVQRLLAVCNGALSRAELQEQLGLRHRDNFIEAYLRRNRLTNPSVKLFPYGIMCGRR